MPGKDATMVRLIADRMNRTERLIVSLHYADGLTLAEVAAVLQRSEEEVARIVATAIDRVRGVLATAVPA